MNIGTAERGVRAAPETRRLAWLALLLLRLGLAASFVAAAVPKIRAPDLFALAIFNYRILPPWGVNTLAIVLPWVELFSGLCLALGIWRRASALVIAGMMVVFMAAFVSASARGLDIACGCFEVGSEAEPSAAIWVVLRDAAFLATALLLVRFDWGPRPLDLLRRGARRAPDLAI